MLEESISVSLTIAGNLLPTRKCLSSTPSNSAIIFLSLSPCFAIAVSNLLVQAVFTVALADCRSKLLVEHIDGLRQACQKVQKAKKVFGKGAAGSIRYATMLIGKIMWIASISIQSNTAWCSKRRCGHIPVFIAMWQKDCCILNGAWPRNWLGILASAPCSVGGKSPSLRFLTQPRLAIQHHCKPKWKNGLKTEVNAIARHVACFNIALAYPSVFGIFNVCDQI